MPAIATPASADLLTIADLRLGERVLDVACGTGVIARLAAERVGPTGTVSGIDLAPDMIDVARAKTAPTGTAIEWHVGADASRRCLGVVGTRVRRVLRGRRLAAAVVASSLVIGTTRAAGATGPHRDVEVAITDGTSNT